MARSKPADSTAPSGKGSGRAPKLDKNGQPKVGRLKKLGGQARMIKQAYSLTRRNDPKLPWVMLIWFVAVAAVVELIGILLDSPLVFLPLALITGGLAALIVFGRRAQGSAYRQVEGQPGAAAWVLEGMRGDWRGTPRLPRTPQMGAAHPPPGRPRVTPSARGGPRGGGGLP